MILAAVAGLGSCSAVRHCKAPEVDFPAAIAGGAAADSLAIADMEWWRFYGDSTLCNIIRHTLANNKDMLAAAARVERMRQLYRIGKAERLPSVSGTAYADHETNDYAGEEPSRDPEFGAKATVSWELDLWGNLRWAKRKGGAEYLASVEDRRAMQMTLVAEVAAAYFRLMALDNELSIVRRTLITRSEGAYQAQLRFEGGLTSETVFQQAKVEYASTAALIPDLERKIEVMENSISLLMGENPDWRVVRSKMNTEAEFAELRRELQETGYLRRSGKEKKGREKPIAPREFRSSSGLRILVGRSNVQNDALTRKADKRDLWLHTQKIHGSHVILCTEDGAYDDESLHEAALLAAYYSQAQGGSNVPVDYTSVKYVKKPAGARPGMVVYETYRTLYVTPDEETIRRLDRKNK